MKEIFWERAEHARNFGSFAFVCLAIVIWIGARACFAFFEEAIFCSVRECLLWGIQHRPLRWQSQTKNLRQIKTNNANHVGLAPVTGSRLGAKASEAPGYGCSSPQGEEPTTVLE
jgi:hypothetical protein